MKIRTLSLALVALVGVACPASAQTILDNFNRGNNDNMGGNWVEQAGNMEVFNNFTRSTGAAQTQNLMTFVGANGPSAFIDVTPGASLDYAAVVLGYANNNNNLYIKVQSNGGNFTDLGWYFGLNGNNNGAWSQSGFFPGSFNFSSAR